VVCLIVVVWLPEWNAATYTVLPSGLTAKARGASAKKDRILIGRPPTSAPGAAASNTHTSARGTLWVVC